MHSPLVRKMAVYAEGTTAATPSRSYRPMQCILSVPLQLGLMINFSSCHGPISNLFWSLVLTSNQPTFQYLFKIPTNKGYHMFGLPLPRLKPPSPVSIVWNCTTGICQAHVACCHTGTLVHWDSNPDRVAMFGIPRSIIMIIDIWVDSPSQICEILVTM